jgi:ferredoxin
MKITVNTNACGGQGVCTGIRPDVFNVGDDDTVSLLTESFTDADRQDLADAVFLCPTQALRLEM